MAPLEPLGWSAMPGAKGHGAAGSNPCTQAWRDCTLFLSTHSSCLNHRPNDFRFFPIFLYYYLSLFLLQFSDHELLNVCLLSNSLLPPRHTAAVPPAWDGCQLLPPAPPAAVGPLTMLGTWQGSTRCQGWGQGATQALGPAKALPLAPLQQCKGSQPWHPWLGQGMH